MATESAPDPWTDLTDYQLAVAAAERLIDRHDPEVAAEIDAIHAEAARREAV